VEVTDTTNLELVDNNLKYQVLVDSDIMGYIFPVDGIVEEFCNVHVIK